MKRLLLLSIVVVYVGNYAAAGPLRRVGQDLMRMGQRCTRTIGTNRSYSSRSGQNQGWNRYGVPTRKEAMTAVGLGMATGLAYGIYNDQVDEQEAPSTLDVQKLVYDPTAQIGFTAATIKNKSLVQGDQDKPLTQEDVDALAAKIDMNQRQNQEFVKHYFPELARIQNVNLDGLLSPKEQALYVADQLHNGDMEIDPALLARVQKTIALGLKQNDKDFVARVVQNAGNKRFSILIEPQKESNELDVQALVHDPTAQIKFLAAISKNKSLVKGGQDKPLTQEDVDALAAGLNMDSMQNQQFVEKYFSYLARIPHVNLDALLSPIEQAKLLNNELEKGNSDIDPSLLMRVQELSPLFGSIKNASAQT